MNTTEPIRAALVEDARDTREMLAALLNSTPGLVCVAACESAEEALRKIPKAAADIALVDLRLPGKSGVECLRGLKEACPKLALMVLTNFDDPEILFGAIQAGASGYLLKRTPPTQIVEAIRELHAGGSPMTPEIARRVLESLHDSPGAPPPQQLSAREREVLHLASKGHSYQSVADQLGISHGTVRTHFRNAYEKLHVRSLAQALQRIGLKASGRPPRQ